MFCPGKMKKDAFHEEQTQKDESAQFWKMPQKVMKVIT